MRASASPQPRNDGAAAAQGDVLAFLDGDMIADPWWLESHMRWHHVTDSALVLGFRDHIDPDWLSEEQLKALGPTAGLADLAQGRRVERPEWIEFHMARTKNLTTADTDLFRVVTGGNLTIGREAFREVGGFDDSFRAWGGEDTEFGWRCWLSGLLLIPERGAHCWHQGLGTTPDPEESKSQSAQAKKLAHLIAHPAIRPSMPGRTWERPRIWARVGSGEAEQGWQRRSTRFSRAKTYQW